MRGDWGGADSISKNRKGAYAHMPAVEITPFGIELAEAREKTRLMKAIAQDMLPHINHTLERGRFRERINAIKVT